MKVVEKIEIELTPDEIGGIIKEHFKNKEVEINNINYCVNGVNADGDWRSEYPLTYELTKVVCTGDKPKTL